MYNIKVSPLFFNHFKDEKGFRGAIEKETKTYVQIDIGQKDLDSLKAYAELFADAKSEQAKEHADLHRASRRVLKRIYSYGLD